MWGFEAGTWPETGGAETGEVGRAKDRRAAQDVGSCEEGRRAGCQDETEEETRTSRGSEKEGEEDWTKDAKPPARRQRCVSCNWKAERRVRAEGTQGEREYKNKT